MNSRLAGCLALSLGLHLLVALVWTLGEAPLPRKGPPRTVLRVELARLAPGDAARSTTPSLPPSPPATATGDSPRGGDELSQRARFRIAPDLSPFEDLPVAAPGSLTLRLRISAAGIVEQVALQRADPAPSALVDGIVAAVRRARLDPALRDGRPVASELDIVIRYQPGNLPAEPAPGSASVLSAQ